MKQIILFVTGVCAGCAMDSKDDTWEPPSTPTLTYSSMSPTSGDWGTTITITGTNFGAMGSLQFVGATDLDDGPVVMTWSDTQVTARIPFPAVAGAITLHRIDGGSVTTTDTFTPTPTWSAGDPVTMKTVIESKLLPDGSAVLLGTVSDHDGLELVIFNSGHATTYPITGVTVSTDDRTPTAARLAVDGNGAPIVYATNATGNVITVTTSATTDTMIAGVVRAADQNGAWFTTAAGLSHLHAGTFAIDRGPITTAILDAEIASDGTLVVVTSVDAGEIFDKEAYVQVSRLAPGASTFANAEDAAGPYDDFIAAARMWMSSDGNRALVEFSTQENDETIDHPQWPASRTAAGQWAAATGLIDGQGAVVYLPSTAAELDSRDGELELVPDVNVPTMITKLPMWPGTPAGLFVTTTGALRPLVRIYDRVWFPMPPAT
ncbi:MAG: IPT/TIG domain-containing protein [Kofleriaceae bacterium]